MANDAQRLTATPQALLEFYLGGLRIPSFSDEEGPYARYIVAEMQRLGYDEAYIDPAGNAVGRVGDGPRVIHFDSHMDTVRVTDANAWDAPPFEGRVVNGMACGRGSVDMKGGLSASVYAAAAAKQAGLICGRTVYVTGSVCEEYCDGVCLEHFYRDRGLKPDYCVICEPSDNRVVLGHTGKVQARIRTHGVSAHGSAPELGVNAVYEMAEIIARVEGLNQTLQQTPGGGTVALTQISCESASLNAVPSECEIYLDRRLRFGETTKKAFCELDALVLGKRADWELGTLLHTSWNKKELVYRPAHEPWKIEEAHPLTKALLAAYRAALGREPGPFDFWDFGTNAVVPVSMGVPTIGFGPGEYKLAHMRNERCSLKQVEEAWEVYTRLIAML